MKDQILAAWRSISVAQAVVFLGLLAVGAFIGIHLPAEVWARILEKSPGDLGAGVGAFLLALYGVLFTGPKSSGTDAS